MAGYVALAAVTTDAPASLERWAFRTMNGTKEDQEELRLPQQLGTPWVLPVTALVALAAGRRRLALQAALALPVEKGLEVATKKLSRRPRPAQAPIEARLHDDAPTEGPSYPSGHAAIAVAWVVLVAPHLPDRLVGGLGAAAAVASYTRIHQGAHFPADSLGGMLLGVVVGCGLRAATDR